MQPKKEQDDGDEDDKRIACKKTKIKVEENETVKYAKAQKMSAGHKKAKTFVKSEKVV